MDRCNFFKHRDENRFWWHQIPGHDYTPPIYGFLDHNEWSILTAWYQDTLDRGWSGESSVPFMSLLQGIVMGNAVKGIVECGHYAGWSTLLLGFMVRRMGHKYGLYSIDVDPSMSEYVASWLRRAQLGDYVTLACVDSADPELPARARTVIAGDIGLVVIDSSHQYAHTILELDVWYQALRQGGIIALHDVSDFAATFDATNQGGVKRAMLEWASRSKAPHILLNPGSHALEALTYGDGCGACIVQKPF